jgi:hypothetical protein
MLENTLETKCTALVFITLPMATATRDHGMKDGSKAMACIPSVVATLDVGNGMLGTSGPLSPL